MSSNKFFNLPITVLVTVLLSACAGAPGVESSSPVRPWGSEIDELITASKDYPSASFVEKVLLDNQISDLEIQEAASIQVQCMLNSGYTNYVADPIKNRHGLGNTLPSNNEGMEKAKRDEDACNQKSAYFDLYSLYSVMKRNPDQQDEMEVTAACLVKLKVVQPTYTGLDYTNDIEKYLHEHADENNYVDSDPALGIPFIVAQEEGLQAAYLCRTDPQSVLKTTK